MKDGTIFAWHRSRINPSAESLADYGIKGTNDYRDMWRKRNIYDLKSNL